MWLKNTLIITDNIELLSFIKSLVKELEIEDKVKIDYMYSSKNKIPEILIQSGAQPVDLSSKEQCTNLTKDYEIIISAHCKQIFPDTLTQSVKCINIHPGFNPFNRGWYPQVFSIINKQPAGATIHEMDQKIDHGPIICQKMVNIEEVDTSIDVYNKVIAAEKELLREFLIPILSLSYDTKAPTSEGNYNSIKDFKNLCELDLDDVSTLRDHINLLRALSHGDYRNAFFIDKDQSKIFVKISLNT